MNTRTHPHPSTVDLSSSLAGTPNPLRIALMVAFVSYLETLRRKLIWIISGVTATFLILFGIVVHLALAGLNRPLSNLELKAISNILVQIAVYSGALLSSIIGIVISGSGLGSALESGTLEAVISKPVRRTSIYCGKWLFSVAITSAYFTLLELGPLVICYFYTSYLPAHVPIALLNIWIGVLTVVTLCYSLSIVMPWLAACSSAFGLLGFAVVCGWIERYGAQKGSLSAADLGILASLIQPADSLFRRALYLMRSPLTTMLHFGISDSTSAASSVVTFYSLLYVIILYLGARRAFSEKDL